MYRKWRQLWAVLLLAAVLTLLVACGSNISNNAADANSSIQDQGITPLPDADLRSSEQVLAEATPVEAQPETTYRVAKKIWYGQDHASVIGWEEWIFDENGDELGSNRYDPDGALSSSRICERIYDEDGVSHLYTYNSDEKLLCVQNYDVNGRYLGHKYAFPSTSEYEEVEYIYHDNGNLAKEIILGGAIVKLYDIDGHILSYNTYKHNNDGSLDAFPAHTEEYDYEVNNGICIGTASMYTDGKLQWSEEYIYDANYLLLSKKDTFYYDGGSLFGEGYSTHMTEYTYDEHRNILSEKTYASPGTADEFVTNWVEYEYQPFVVSVDQ